MASSAVVAVPTDPDEGTVQQTPEEAWEEAGEALGQLFPMQPPRDVIAGLYSGVKCVLSGVCFGVVSIIIQPIQGTSQAGVAGCFRGVGAGLLSAVLLSCTGLFTGALQALRGVAATPRAICMASRGWEWDRDTGRWNEPTVYSLPEEAAKVLEETEVGSGAGRSSNHRALPPRSVADTYYYDLLGVPTTASEREIRRAYFALSKRWHPDKTTEDGAKERFQAISEAYQMLSDPERREQYDAHGRKLDSQDLINSRIFFSVLFSSNVVEPLVGQLTLADFFDLTSKDSEEAATADPASRLLDSQQSEAEQVKRQVKLAVDLASRLQPFVEGDREAQERVVQEALEEARNMLKSDEYVLVSRILREVGWVYQNCAECHLARLESPCFGRWGLRSMWMRFRSGRRKASRRIATVRLTVRSLVKLRHLVKAVDAAEEQGDDSDDTAMWEAVPTFVETFLSWTMCDIAGTLDKAIHRLLTDGSVPLSSLRLRALGLREVGHVFEREATRHQSEVAKRLGGSDDAQKLMFEKAFKASVGEASDTVDAA